MKQNIVKVSILMVMVFVSASAMAKVSNLPIHDQKFCQTDCSKKYAACNGVEQCQDYVVMSCMRDCLRSGK